MKKFFILILVLLSLNSQSQITFDFQVPIEYFETIHLTNSEAKYFDDNQWNMNHQNQFNLYNLNGTLYKTIPMPSKPHNDSAFFFGIRYITRTLFDNDPSNIEYIIEYQWDSLPPYGYGQHEVKIVREDNTILLDEMDARVGYINTTEEGTKLTLQYYHAIGTFYTTKVFNLPGEIPTNVGEAKSITKNISLYPNPNNGSFYIKNYSKSGVSEIIKLFSSSGKLINTYKSINDLTHIQNICLPDGLYLISTIDGNTNSTLKMIIKN